MWENTRPLDHWKFWHRLEIKQGASPEVKVTSAGSYHCRKNAYNLGALVSFLGDRMLAYGRMGRAGADPLDRQVIDAAEYMPPTLEEFRAVKSRCGEPEGVSYREQKMQLVSDELAQRFYETTYTLKDLRADLKSIKVAMKTVPRW